MTMNRRMSQRIRLGASTFQATWLSDWRKIEETGLLNDISAGGFGGLMAHAPRVGHPFHVRLQVQTGAGQGEAPPIEVTAQLCQRQHPAGENDNSDRWIVHCAIETIHPTEQAQWLRLLTASQQGH